MFLHNNRTASALKFRAKTRVVVFFCKEQNLLFMRYPIRSLVITAPRAGCVRGCHGKRSCLARRDRTAHLQVKTTDILLFLLTRISSGRVCAMPCVSHPTGYPLPALGPCSSLKKNLRVAVDVLALYVGQGILSSTSRSQNVLKDLTKKKVVAKSSSEKRFGGSCSFRPLGLLSMLGVGL